MALAFPIPAVSKERIQVQVQDFQDLTTLFYWLMEIAQKQSLYWKLFGHKM